MPIEIAKTQLTQIHHLSTLEQANWVTHHVPGREGTVTQDLGRASVRLDIRGICYGPNAQADLDHLRRVHKQRDAVDFLADIVGQSYFSQVIIEQLEVTQSALAPDEFSYRLVVAEFKPAKASASGVSNVNQAIKADAASFLTVASLPDALQMGALPTITNPIEPLQGAIAPIQEATQGVGQATAGLRSILGL